MYNYDYVIVGAGLFGCTFAFEAKKRGKKCLVIEKREHIGGNIYCENIENINVHKYGAHIFHTSDENIWKYVSQFAKFNRYTNTPIAIFENEVFNMPFNMNTFSKLWKIKTPAEAMKKIQEQIEESGIIEPQNLEEQAIKLVGKDIYEKLVKGYTEKQWGKKATELPAFIIQRLPVRFTYDNNYFNDLYQGIPIGGYNQITEKMLEGVDVELNTNFFDNKSKYMNIAKKVIFTGMIDEFYEYKFGELEYRSLKLETSILDIDNYQGNAVVNYTEYDIPYTRIIEHKHFEFGNQKKTVITKEYPKAWSRNDEPFYPINDLKNNLLYERYKKISENEDKVIFGGRLGNYKYYDMHNVIEQALKLSEMELI